MIEVESGTWHKRALGGCSLADCEYIEDSSRADAARRCANQRRILHVVDVDQSFAGGGLFSHDDDDEQIPASSWWIKFCVIKICIVF